MASEEDSEEEDSGLAASAAGAAPPDAAAAPPPGGESKEGGGRDTHKALGHVMKSKYNGSRSRPLTYIYIFHFTSHK
jgi:hypothetical protein